MFADIQVAALSPARAARPTTDRGFLPALDPEKGTGASTSAFKASWRSRAAGFHPPGEQKTPRQSEERELEGGGGRRHGVGLSNASSGNGQCPLIPLSLLQDADVLLLLSTFVACHHQNCHGR